MNNNFQNKFNCMNNYRNVNYRNMNANPNGDRFFWAPFLVGGLAGTALGYGIANNQAGRYYYPPVYYQPAPPMPYYYNNFYY